MLLCDHIVFWMRHNELPAFENRFEMLMYEMGVAFNRMSETVAAAMKPVIVRAIIDIMEILADTRVDH